MGQHFLVFIAGRWVRTNRLPVPKVPPPEPHQIRWNIRGWESSYCVCSRNRIWRKPHTTLVEGARPRRKGWKEVLIQERRPGYKGVDLWRDGHCFYFSLVALRRLLQRVHPTESAADVPANRLEVGCSAKD